MLHSNVIAQMIVTIGSTLFFVRHHAISFSGRFDYAYNMKVNVLTGVISGLGWMVWFLLQPRKRQYAWKMCVFQILSAATIWLELLDFPPIWWILDSHALWHLSTVPLTTFLYR